jgi:hypothetical protein
MRKIEKKGKIFSSSVIVLAFLVLAFVNCDSEISKKVENDCENVLCWPKCCQEDEIYFMEIANCAKWKNINDETPARFLFS